MPRASAPAFWPPSRRPRPSPSGGTPPPFRRHLALLPPSPAPALPAALRAFNPGALLASASWRCLALPSRRRSASSPPLRLRPLNSSCFSWCSPGFARLGVTPRFRFRSGDAPRFPPWLSHRRCPAPPSRVSVPVPRPSPPGDVPRLRPGDALLASALGSCLPVVPRVFRPGALVSAPCSSLPRDSRGSRLCRASPPGVFYVKHQFALRSTSCVSLV